MQGHLREVNDTSAPIHPAAPVDIAARIRQFWR